MNLFSTILRRLRSLGQRRAAKREIDEELRFHIEQRTAENIAAGMSPDEAAREARKRFGNLQNVREECREVSGASFGDMALQDVRFGVRVLRKNPGFTTVAVLTLAVGIGANTAIFTVINGVLLKPLPYDEPSQLVIVWEKPGDHTQGAYVAGGVFLDWKEQNTVFESLSALSRGIAMNFTGNGEPERIRGWAVSPNFPHTLRLEPALGRGFLPDEDKRGQNQVVLLTHSLWQRRFGGDTNIVGRSVRLDSDSYTIIGVLPPKAIPHLADSVNENAEFVVPLMFQDWQKDRSGAFLTVIGRIKPGITMAQAQAELLAIKQRLQSEYPKDKEKWGSLVVPLHEQISGRMKPTLLLLFGAAVCVLLIACANVAGLLLAKAVSRQREMAIRAALGANRWRVVRQVLTESMLLGLTGGALGLLLARWGIELLLRFQNDPLFLAREAPLDMRVLTFCLLASVGTGISFGLIPALQISAPNIYGALKDSARSSASSSRHRLRSGLVIAQVAVALVLLVGSGLLLKSLYALLNVPTGFIPQHALGMDISLSKRKYPDGESRVQFYRQVFQRLEALPGVEAAGSVTILPMTGGSLGASFTVEGRRNQPEFGYDCGFDFVGGQFFRSAGIPLLDGREFNEHDNSTKGPRVCIFNEAQAKKVFPGENPIGKRIRFGGDPWEIVGVVGSIRHYGLEGEPDGRMYLPQVFGGDGSMIVRASSEPLALAGAVRKAILSIDPDQPISNVRTLEQAIARSVATRHLTLMLLGLFAGLALLLSTLGLYGVLAYTVKQRTNEIGIRMALGAQRRDVLWLVLWQGMRLAIVGVTIGVAVALALTRVITSLLFEVKPTDPLTFAGVSLFLLFLALLACYLPARRATQVDPMAALRYE